MTAWTFVRQADGSQCQFQNCGLAGTAMLVYAERNGTNPHHSAASWPPRPAEMRRKLNLYCPGTNFTQAHSLALSMYGSTLGIRYGAPWLLFCQYNIAGRMTAFSGSYHPLHGTAFDHAPLWRAANQNHRFVVKSTRWDSGKHERFFTIADPLGTVPQEWPATLVKKVAGLALVGNGETVGVGYVNYMFSRDLDG